VSCRNWPLKWLKLAEASGALSPWLAVFAEFYEGRRKQSAGEHVFALIEPAILMLMAVLIAFILWELYLAIVFSVEKDRAKDRNRTWSTVE